MRQTVFFSWHNPTAMREDLCYKDDEKANFTNTSFCKVMALTTLGESRRIGVLKGRKQACTTILNRDSIEPAEGRLGHQV